MTPDTTTYHEIMLADGTRLEYGLYLPPGYDPARPYPILLALPPGDQTLVMVRWGLETYWVPGARAAGWLVVSPAAPGDRLMFRGGEDVLPAFLGRVATAYEPAGGKFALGGVSNGGRAAFRIAIERPDLFLAMAVLPGYPTTAADFERIGDLAGMPVALWVGEADRHWVEQMEATAAALTAAGGQVELTLLPGEGHVIQSLAGGAPLFDFFSDALSD